jgi:hypothetical protein
LAQYRRQYEIQTPIQNGLVAPRSVSHDVVQRLMHAPHIVGSQSGSHRLDTFPLARQQQSGAVVLEGDVSIGVPCGFCQALDICRKALFLWAWPMIFAHGNNSTSNCLFITQ